MHFPKRDKTRKQSARSLQSGGTALIAQKSAVVMATEHQATHFDVTAKAW